ncbi:hypothetical protein GCM10027589_31980 [Actinocorallia lasiicapitis]
MSAGTYEFQSEFARTHRAEGRAEGLVEGEARAIFTVLETRGFAVPRDVIERISACAELSQLEAWLIRAITVEDVHDLFV